VSRLVARAVRDVVAASPGSGTYAAALLGVAVEAALAPGAVALAAAVAPSVGLPRAIGGVLGLLPATAAGGLVVGYGTGNGRALDALGTPATWAYAVLPLLVRWLLALEVVGRLAGADATFVGDTIYLAGIVTPVAVVGAVAGSALAPRSDRRPRRDPVTGERDRGQ